MIKISRYYAVAIGREQKVTTDYNEVKRLTQGYPKAKFKRFNTPEEAQKFIDDVIVELTGRELNDFEEERKLLPAFTNKDNRIVTPRTGVFITAEYYEKFNIRVFDEIMGNYVTRSSVRNNSVSATIITPSKLSFPLEDSEHVLKGRNETNIYKFTLVETLLGRNEKQKLLITSMISIIEELQSSGIKELSLFCNSNYLTELFVNNIFYNSTLIGLPIAYEIEIKKLYELLYSFDYIFVNYYSGKIMPDLLKFNIKRVNKLNEVY